MSPDDLPGAAFAYDDPCVARSAHAGRHAEAGAAARRDALAFLRVLFRLG